MSTPTIAVLDLTSRIGAYALAQMGVSGATVHGIWEGMPLAGVAGAPLINWYRPSKADQLTALPPNPDAVAVLVGPGIFSMLPAVLAHSTVRNAAAVWFLLLPNAMMEDIEIAKFLVNNQRTGVHKYQLPNSDPQTLWFVLMEQMGKIKSVSDYFNEESLDINMREPLKTAVFSQSQAHAA